MPAPVLNPIDIRTHRPFHLGGAANRMAQHSGADRHHNMPPGPLPRLPHHMQRNHPYSHPPESSYPHQPRYNSSDIGSSKEGFGFGHSEQRRPHQPPPRHNSSDIGSSKEGLGFGHSTGQRGGHGGAQQGFGSGNFGFAGGYGTSDALHSLSTLYRAPGGSREGYRNEDTRREMPRQNYDAEYRRPNNNDPRTNMNNSDDRRTNSNTSDDRRKNLNNSDDRRPNMNNNDDHRTKRQRY